MTTLALVVGSIPIAIGIGEGSEFRRGLSIVLIGGLITSMLLTLLVVPTAYSLLESITRRVAGLFRRGRAPEPELAAEGAAAGVAAPVIAHHDGVNGSAANSLEAPELEPQERL
jgi:HAE1 family hydrophobic/amphiphilic exporter-1